MDRLHSFALVKTFYDTGRDYIDASWPLVLDALEPQEQIPLERLQKRIDERFALLIPIHPLETIITRASRKSLVERKARLVHLTEAGQDTKEKLDPSRDVERRVNQLIAAARRFLSSRGIDRSDSETGTSLQSFVATNLEFFERLLAPSGQATEVQTDHKVESALLESYEKSKTPSLISFTPYVRWFSAASFPAPSTWPPSEMSDSDSSARVCS